MSARDELALRLAALGRQIGARWVVGFENFDGGHPFIEVADGPVYRFQAYERGKRLFLRETTDLDEVLYWAMSATTRDLAWSHAARHPVPGEEQRFTALRRQRELLRTLNPAWADRL